MVLINYMIDPSLRARELDFHGKTFVSYEIDGIFRDFLGFFWKEDQPSREKNLPT
jgi:hypothetical protein